MNPVIVVVIVVVVITIIIIIIIIIIVIIIVIIIISRLASLSWYVTVLSSWTSAQVYFNLVLQFRSICFNVEIF